MSHRACVTDNQVWKPPVSAVPKGQRPLHTSVASSVCSHSFLPPAEARQHPALPGRWERTGGCDVQLDKAPLRIPDSDE